MTRHGNKIKRTGKLFVATRVTRSGPFDQQFHAALQEAIDYAEKRVEFRAQHGPVRILVKDGKPCEEL